MPNDLLNPRGGLGSDERGVVHHAADRGDGNPGRVGDIMDGDGCPESGSVGTKVRGPLCHPGMVPIGGFVIWLSRGHSYSRLKAVTCCKGD